MTVGVMVQSGFFAKCARAATDVWRDATRAWYLTIPIAVVWMLALLRVFGDPTPQIPLLFNVTPSLPYTVAWLERGVLPKRGEFVLYNFSGPARRDYPGLDRQPLFKIVAGVAGDRISVQGRDVFVNGRGVGRAKERLFDGRRVSPIAEQTIPEGYIYARGSHLDSFDSRYQEAGLVPTSAIIGKVVPWL